MVTADEKASAETRKKPAGTVQRSRPVILKQDEQDEVGWRLRPTFVIPSAGSEPAF